MAPGRPAYGRLTKHEWIVLRMAAGGMALKTIALVHGTKYETMKSRFEYAKLKLVDQ